MTHRDVPVRAHDEQKDAAGELVHARAGHVSFAHEHAEGPALKADGRDKKGDAYEKTLVGYCEVQNVHVSDRLHLGEPQHHVDDQGIAEDAYEADDHVEDLREQAHNWHVIAAVVEGDVRARVKKLERGTGRHVRHHCDLLDSSFSTNPAPCHHLYSRIVSAWEEILQALANC